jgi:glycosyltransferase involved in cell wall biosynthesis
MRSAQVQDYERGDVRSWLSVDIIARRRGSSGRVCQMLARHPLRSSSGRMCRLDRTYGATTEPYRRRPAKLDLIEESVEDGILVLRPRDPHAKPIRRIVFVSDYGQAAAWRLWKDGVYPGNHLWGCIELAIMGYEVLLPETASGHGIRKRLKNDWFPTLAAVRELRRDDIVFCSHNVLLWSPLFKALSLVKCKIVGFLYGREPLPLANRYDAIIAETPVALENAAHKYPRVRSEHISIGMDLDFFEMYPHDPRWMLSCGKTFRDFAVLADAFTDSDVPVKLLHPEPSSLPDMPTSVEVVSVADIGEGIYAPLAHHFYRYASATLITMTPDPTNRHCIGLTNVFESMASGRPFIATRTSAMTSEIDLASQPIGIFVDPADAGQLRAAAERLHRDPEDGLSLGRNGRRLCEDYFNVDRYANDLHRLFEDL